MNIIKSLIVASMLLAGSAHADGFGFNLGPFNMQFGASEPEYLSTNRSDLENPFCAAIESQKKVEFTVRGTDIVSAKEKKLVVKTIVVEPYAFGSTRDGKPVLHGKVVSEKLVMEATVKFGEDRFDENGKTTKDKGDGYFTGKFNSDKSKDIDISKVSNIHIINDSHFDVPKDFKAIKDDNVHFTCQLPVAQEK